jgi:hypothetical protein
MCGLTNYIDARFTPELQRIGFGDFYTVPFGEKDIENTQLLISKPIASEPEEAGDGEIFVKGATFGGYEEDTVSEAQVIIDAYEGGGYQLKLWNVANPRKYYTHHKFLQAQFWIACDRPENYIKKCRSRGSCKNCSHRIDLSFKEREKGLLKGEAEDQVSQLDRRFSWPFQCLSSFKWLPCMAGRYETLSDEEFGRYYSQMNEEFSKIPTYEPMPTAPKTIKKLRPKGKEWGGVLGPNRTVQGPSRGIPPYLHNVYRGTAISDLLEANPKTGREALFNLFSYFIVFALGKPQDELTSKNLIKFSMNMMPLHSKRSLKRDLAEKQFELLTKYKVVHILERLGQDGLLYMALPQRMRGLVHWNDLPQ